MSAESRRYVAVFSPGMGMLFFRAKSDAQAWEEARATAAEEDEPSTVRELYVRVEPEDDADA